MNIIQKLIIKLIEGRYKKMFTAIREFLAGKKTYLLAAGMIISALIEYTADGDLSKLISKILEALTISGLRAGVSKVIK